VRNSDTEKKTEREPTRDKHKNIDRGAAQRSNEFIVPWEQRQRKRERESVCVREREREDKSFCSICLKQEE